MTEEHFKAELDPEIVEFGDVVRRALAGAGGYDLVMRAESDPSIHLDVVEPILHKLDVFDLVPHLGEDQLQAAAVACQAMGRFAAPYPLAEHLAGTSVAIPPGTVSNGRPRALAVAADASGYPGPTRVNMGGLEFEWWVVRAPSASIARATGAPPRKPGRLGPFVADLECGAEESSDVATLALALHLQSFTLLGMLSSALDLTVGHSNDRVQFGAPIVSFQAVQHRLATALIALEAFERQAHYALWSIAQNRASQLVDVVGARLSGLTAADLVLRAGHQLHGATGFCDEAAISRLSRHSQPLRRLPLDPARTDQWFVDLVISHGFDGLFPMSPPNRQPATTHGAAARKHIAPVSGAHA